MKKVMFISSTGGHLDELMQLKPLFSKYNYHIVTEKDKMTQKLKEEHKDKISYLVYGTRNKPITYIFKLLYNCILSLILYLKYKPKYIVTTGTHITWIWYLLLYFLLIVRSIENVANWNW